MSPKSLSAYFRKSKCVFMGSFIIHHFISFQKHEYIILFLFVIIFGGQNVFRFIYIIYYSVSLLTILWGGGGG